MSTTVLEGCVERDERRAAYMKRLGFDPLIPENVAEAILEEVEKTFSVTRVEFTGLSLRLSVMPLLGRRMCDVQATTSRLLERYGNPPYSYATECDLYRIAFIVT